MASIDDYMRRQQELIDQYGWAVTPVFPTEDAPGDLFAYTVGLTAHFTDRPLCDHVVRARPS